MTQSLSAVRSAKIVRAGKHQVLVLILRKHNLNVN